VSLVLSVIMLSIIKQNVIMLSVIMLSIIFTVILNDIMLSAIFNVILSVIFVVILGVIMLDVIIIVMLGVSAAKNRLTVFRIVFVPEESLFCVEESSATEDSDESASESLKLSELDGRVATKTVKNETRFFKFLFYKNIFFKCWKL
jgi:hypothetical protein